MASSSLLRVVRGSVPPLLRVVRGSARPLLSGGRGGRWRTCGSIRHSSTISPEEVAKFSQLQWWAEDGWLMRSLHSMNCLRVPLVQSSLLGIPLGKEVFTVSPKPHPLGGYHILDAGCGAGFLSEPLCRLGGEVTGLDLSEEAVAVAQHHASTDPDVYNRVSYRCQSIEEFHHEEQGQRRFDCVVASEVVEHVADLPLFITLLTQLLKPRGHAVFTTINRTAMSFAQAIITAEYIIGLLPVGTHDWRKFVQPTELAEALESNGLKVNVLRGMAFNPITNKWVWSDDTSVNYALTAMLSD